VKSNDTIGKLLELIAGMSNKPEPGKTSGGALVVFLSAKGGVGTSSLCANIAMNTGTIFPQAHIALMDLVLPIGSIASMVGYTDRLNLLSVAAQKTEVITPAFLRENLPKVPAWRVQLLAGSSDPESAMNLHTEGLSHIVRTMKTAFDAVFVDTGRALSRISIPILLEADVIVLVTSPEYSSISMTRKVMDYLKTQEIDPRHYYLILNRTVSVEGLSKSEIEKVLEMDVKVTIPFLEGNMALANDRHQPYTLKYTNASTSLLFQQTTRQIIEQAHHLRGG
jgi:MinD-like ATPase involved in chromosome partitioning or flagellar assembly